MIPALPNVFTVATVDVDLEGRPLSRKLLDRVGTLTVCKGDITGVDTGGPTPVYADSTFLQTVYDSLDQCPEEGVMADIAVFESINRILTAANTYIGYKLRNDGVLYLAHNRLTGAVTDSAAMDRVICEKILSRLQGTPKNLPVLQELTGCCAAAGYSRSVCFLQRMMDRVAETGLSDYWDCL